MNEKSLKKQTINGALWIGGVKAFNAIIQFGILATLARLLSPTDFGLMGLALIVVSFSDIFTDLGFGPAITQKKKLSKIDIYTGFTCSVILGMILLVLLSLLSPVFAAFFQNKELISIFRVISVVLLLKSVTTVPLGLMYRNLEFKKLSLIQIISYVIGYGIIGIILAFLGYGVWSLVIGVICQSALSLIFYLYFNKNILHIAFNKESFKKLLYFGGGYSLSKIFSYIGNKGDSIVVGRTLGVESLGLYERGYQLVKYTTTLIGEIVDKVLFSPISKKQDNRILVGQIFLELTHILAIVFFPLSLFVYSSAKPIVFILLGDQWGGTVDIVEIISFSMFFLISTRVGSTIAKSLGDVYNRALRVFFYSIFVVCGSYIASKWGVNEVVLAVTLSVIINYFLAFSQIKKLTGISFSQFVKSHSVGLLLAVFYYIGYYILTIILNNSVLSFFTEIFINGLLLATIYCVAYFIGLKPIIRKYIQLFKK